MKIFYVAGESSNWVINLCNEFCNMGHDVTCMIQKLDEYDSYHPPPIHEKLKRVELSYELIFSPKELYDEIIKNTLENKPDIIFGSHAPVCPAVVEAARVLGVPSGIMILDIPSDLMATNPIRAKNWEYWFEFLKVTDLIVVNTEVARQEFQKHTNLEIPEENMIFYAINQPPQFDMAGAEIKGDYVVSVCRLSELKNCILIPKALATLDKGIKYVAIGRDNGQLNEIKEICLAHDIPFEYKETLSEEDKYEMIKNSSMLIYPQKTEYIGGLSPFEAMYAGKPVLVPNLKILRDLYADNAIFFDNDGIDSLAMTIAYVHAVRRGLIMKHLKKANAYAKDVASYKTMASKLVKLMEDTIK